MATGMPMYETFAGGNAYDDMSSPFGFLDPEPHRVVPSTPNDNRNSNGGNINADFFQQLQRDQGRNVGSGLVGGGNGEVGGGVLGNGGGIGGVIVGNRGQPHLPPPAWLQLPTFLQTVPNLASGGGAEVVPFDFSDPAELMAILGNPRQNNSLCAEKLQIREIEAAQPAIPVQMQTFGEQNMVEDINMMNNAHAGAFDFEQPLPAPVPTNPQTRTNLSPLLAPPDPINHFLQNHATNSLNQHQQRLTEDQQRSVAGLINTRNTAAILPSPHSFFCSEIMYSASGFDIIELLSRVRHRPNPRINLGPVDLGCAFVLVDTRKPDHPIVYCSPNFMQLSGYEEREVIGRNCRFLQSPTGVMEPGGARPDQAAQQAAGYLRKSLGADKECQTVITNYRKDGTQFMNLVTVIPIPGGVSNGPHEEHDVVFHIGFQVDLTTQPNKILDRLNNGGYNVDYSPSQYIGGNRGPGGSVATRERKSSSMPPAMMSKELKRLLKDPKFLESVEITTVANHPTAASLLSSDVQDRDSVYGGNEPLHMMLLESGPDFIHVVSLKGTFLYVAPSIRRVLGYEPQELLSKTIADLAHSEDVVPLMRELKECSSTGINAGGGADAGSLGAMGAQPTIVPPRVVDLIFRARTGTGCYVWVESRGRLHVEPGKGRKAILLSGRAKEIHRLTWGVVAQGGGLAKMRKVHRRIADGNGGSIAEDVDLWQEFWGTISNGMTMLMVGKGFSDVSGGLLPEEWRGRNLRDLLVDNTRNLERIVERLAEYGPGECQEMVQGTRCGMRTKNGGVVDVHVNVYRPERDINVMTASIRPGGVQPAHLMIQVRLVGAEVYTLLPSSSSPSSSNSPPNPRKRQFSTFSDTDNTDEETKVADLLGVGNVDLSANVFEELETMRGSSWQYELQQLKYGNQRLMDEIAALEAAVKIHSRCGGPPSFPSDGSRTRSSSNASTLTTSSLFQRRQQHRMQIEYPALNHQQHPHHPQQPQPAMRHHGLASGQIQFLPSAALPARTNRVNTEWQDSAAYGTSSLVQRIQNEVAAGSGVGMYGLTSPAQDTLLKRPWGYDR